MENHDSNSSPAEYLDETFGRTALKSVLDTWITPEIERRRAAGKIGDEFRLWMAQAIFSGDGQSEVRLNEEVRAVMMVELTRPVEAGEQVLTTDLSGVVGVELHDDELDCGHFTIVCRGEKGWLLDFNALYGRKKAANLVRLASEFLTASKSAFEHGHSGPCIDNLFSCCELLAKADLIMNLSRGAKGKKHNAISSAINSWSKLGNVPRDFVRLMNRLSNQRHAARYEGTTIAEQVPVAEEFDVVEGYLALLRGRSSSKLQEDVTSNAKDPEDGAVG